MPKDKNGNDGQDNIIKLRADLKTAAKLLTHEEARYLVDLYYQMQEFRKGAGNEVGALQRSGEPPSAVLKYVFDEAETIEKEIRRALDRYTDTQPMGQWAKAIVGIGPVIAAGLIANIDFKPWTCLLKGPEVEPCTRADPQHEDIGRCGPHPLRSVGAIWRFAGLDPSVRWERSTKRPWNARLKTLCWLMGESFVKVSNNPKSLYGNLYQQRKAIESQKNAAGDFAEQAKNILATKNIGKTTEAYKAYIVGKLPPAHIHERAKRWAVKVFLCHYFEEGCRRLLKKEPPLIYSIAMLGHIDYIAPEGAPELPGQEGKLA
jgi:hypothetical protein